MSDELTEYLLNDRHAAKISPEMLEMMGKQAANRLIEDGVALNESIAKLAGAYPDINSEQVKRVAEFANTAVYLAKHDQAKTAGADSSYPQFELADAGRIVQDLTDGARPTKVSPVDVAYGKLPLRTKISSATSDALLADMFGVGVNEQDLQHTKEAAVGELVDAKQNLVSLKENLARSNEQFDQLHKQASADYYDTVKRHLLDGGSLNDVVRAAAEVLPKEKLSSALQPVVKELMRERVLSTVSIDRVDLEKVAHRKVDTAHPLVSLLGATASYKEELEKLSVALREVDQELVNVERAIKESIGARAAR